MVAVAAVTAVALVLLATASTAWGAIASPRTPHVSRREGNFTRTAADVIFGEFVDSIAAANVTAASALLAEDATGMITGYKCEELNKQGLTLVLHAFTQEVEILALIPKYRIVSETHAAFWVEDGALTPPAMGPPGYFHLSNVLFTVELNAAQDKIARFVEYFPTAPTNGTVAMLQTIEALIAADESKNITQLSATLADSFVAVGYPQGQVYPPDVYNKSQLVQQAADAFALTTKNALFVSKTYETCGYVLNEYTQLAKFTLPAGTQRMVNKRINIFHLTPSAGVTAAATAPPGTSSSYAIDAWTSYYWNELSFVPTTQH